MNDEKRLFYLDNLRTFLIFLVVLVHAGVVYESSGFMAPYWIVDDPATSDLPGIVNLLLDTLVMPALFFISGFFSPASLEEKGSWGFLKSKSKRLVVPWILALFTLIPLYNMIFLYSRGMPQGVWTRYFHFTNGTIGMSWLWFLPVLFLFDALYVLLRKMNIPTGRLSFRWAVVGVFALSVASSTLLGELGRTGWIKTPLVDFQSERLLPYFLIFLLGSLCYRKGILTAEKRNKILYIGINATAWIPINVYMIVLLNFFLRPGKYIISGHVDGIVLWTSLYLSMLSLLYCAVTTFKRYFNRQGVLGRALGKASYNVYIIHIIVMGPIALALLDLDIPGLAKYPILAIATYVGSNLLAYGLDVAVSWSLSSRARATPASSESTAPSFPRPS